MRKKGMVITVVAAFVVAVFCGVLLQGKSKKLEEEGTEYVRQITEQPPYEIVTEGSTETEGQEPAELYIDLGGYSFGAGESPGIDGYVDEDIGHAMEVSKNTAGRAHEFGYQYAEDMEVDEGLFSESINRIYTADTDCHRVLLSVLAQYAGDTGKDCSVFETDGYYESGWQEDGLCGKKVHDTSTGETVYVGYADTGFVVTGFVYKVE